MFVILIKSTEADMCFLSELNLDDHENGSVSVRSWITGPLSSARYFNTGEEADAACKLLNRVNAKPTETCYVIEKIMATI